GLRHVLQRRTGVIESSFHVGGIRRPRLPGACCFPLEVLHRARRDGLTLPDLRRIGLHPDFWYPLARSTDVKAGKTHPAAFAGEPIVLARTERGSRSDAGPIPPLRARSLRCRAASCRASPAWRAALCRRRDRSSGRAAAWARSARTARTGPSPSR